MPDESIELEKLRRIDKEIDAYYLKKDILSKRISRLSAEIYQAKKAGESEVARHLEAEKNRIVDERDALE